MKSLTTNLLFTLALGGALAASVLVLPMDELTRVSALWGAGVAAVLGACTFLLKAQLGGQGLKGTAAVKALMTAQVLAFLSRLAAVGVGAFTLQQTGRSPMAFVIAFFVVSLAQQALETRSLLAGANQVKSSEVSS